LWFVLEEADALAPQEPMGDMTRVLGVVVGALRGWRVGFHAIIMNRRYEPEKLFDLMTPVLVHNS